MMGEEKEMKPFMKSLALSVTGEFLLVVGVVFFLWGISSFISSYLGVDGAGQSAVGIFMIVLAFLLLLRSKALLPKKKKKEKEPSESYR
jgi:hypothetical protein